MLCCITVMQHCLVKYMLLHIKFMSWCTSITNATAADVNGKHHKSAAWSVTSTESKAAGFVLTKAGTMHSPHKERQAQSTSLGGLIASQILCSTKCAKA